MPGINHAVKAAVIVDRRCGRSILEAMVVAPNVS